MGFIFSVPLSPCGISQPSDRRRHRQAFLRLQTTSEKVTQITGCMLLCDLDLTRSLFLPYCTSFILGRISFLFYYKRTSRKKYVGKRAIFKLWHTFSVPFREKEKKTESFPSSCCKQVVETCEWQLQREREELKVTDVGVTNMK
jgi:hypothetical protein